MSIAKCENRNTFLFILGQCSRNYWGIVWECTMVMRNDTIIDLHLHWTRTMVFYWIVSEALLNYWISKTQMCQYNFRFLFRRDVLFGNRFSDQQNIIIYDNLRVNFRSVYFDLPIDCEREGWPKYTRHIQLTYWQWMCCWAGVLLQKPVPSMLQMLFENSMNTCVQ